MLCVASSPTWLLDCIDTRDHSTQVKIETNGNSAKTDSETAKYMCAMLRDGCNGGWQHRVKALLKSDERTTVHKHEETWKKEKRR
jgi:hypothetical protein